MTGRILALAPTLCLVLALVVASQCLAAPTLRDQAIASYNAGNIPQAMGQFKSAVQQQPNDALSHYYLALCYQRLNQVVLAQQEYNWVASYSTDPGLKANAQQGLSMLARYSQARLYAGSGVPPQTASPAVYTGGGGRPKVIKFTATWCGPCKRYAPTFEEVTGRYRGRLDVQEIDIDDPTQESMVKRYGVTGVPTTVFLDGRGNLVEQNSGVMDATKLKDKIEGLMGR